MKILPFAFALCVLCACHDSVVIEQTPPDPPVQQEPVTEVTDDYHALSLYRVNDNRAALSIDYDVPLAYQDLQTDRLRHADMWRYVTDLIPLADRPMIGQFQIFISDEIAGYVRPLGSDLDVWRVAMGIDVPGITDDPALQGYYAYALMHEFGHLLTLNGGQIGPGAGCQGVRIDYGCAAAGSYLDDFFWLFWEDILDDYRSMSENAFYQTYKSQFLTSYAATHLLEDIAESFAHFTFLSRAPTGASIADEKVRFFYAYPALTNLRSQIRSRSARAVQLRQVPVMRCGVGGLLEVTH